MHGTKKGLFLKNSFRERIGHKWGKPNNNALALLTGSTAFIRQFTQLALSCRYNTWSVCSPKVSLFFCVTWRELIFKKCLDPADHRSRLYFLLFTVIKSSSRLHHPVTSFIIFGTQSGFIENWCSDIVLWWCCPGFKGLFPFFCNIPRARRLKRWDGEPLSSF